MRTTTLPVIALMFGMLAGCGNGSGNERDRTMSREHEAKAIVMCKHDKGLKRVTDTNGKSFTAECKSGIIVTGSLD